MDLSQDLSKLSKEDLAVVRRWIEDAFVNAICPLATRLQMEMPGTLAADKTLQAAQVAVRKVMEKVECVRALADGKAHGAERPKSEQESPDLMPLQKAGETII